MRRKEPGRDSSSMRLILLDQGSVQLVARIVEAMLPQARAPTILLLVKFWTPEAGENVMLDKTQAPH